MNGAIPIPFGASRRPPGRLPIAGVMGSGVESHQHLAAPLGRLIAEAGCHLLTGGGGGVMAAASEAFCSVPGRRGLSIGILRAGALDPWTSAPPNPWVEIPIHTHLPLSGKDGTSPLSRNHINVLTADLLFVLPGGPGTRSEVELRLRYGRAALLFLGDGRIDGRTASDLLAEFGGNKLLRAASSLASCRAALEDLVAAARPDQTGSQPANPSREI